MITLFQGIPLINSQILLGLCLEKNLEAVVLEDVQ